MSMHRDGVHSSHAAAASPHVHQRRLPGGHEARRFEQLVAELARRFIRTTADEIDREINRSLKDVCLLLGLDRSAVAQIDPVSGWAAISYGWARESNRLMPTSLDPNEYLPWHKKKMLAGEPIIFSSLNELPAEAAVDRETLGRLGPKSSVIVPVRVGGTTFGAVAFGSLYKERQWPTSLVEQFHLVADILGYALERKRNVAEFLRLQSELAHVSRVATLGELTASLAHEMNQPLAAILSNIEAAQFLMRAEKPDLKEIGVALQEIADSDRRATEIIKRFRALFKRGELKKSVFSPGELFDAVQRVTKSEAAIRSVSLKFDCPSSLPDIIADPIQLQQVLLNLLLNAFDSVCAAENGGREVSVRASRPQPEFVQVAVRDRGTGLPRDATAHLFEPFFTTKPDGMGMGLAVARSIIEAHGGRMWAGENPGGGAVFEFTVPAAAAQQPSNRSSHPCENQAALLLQGLIKVAVIDDDASQRNSLVRLLGSAGHEVCPFGSATEFLASPEGEGFSCVVSDLRMPGVDGLGLQDALRGKSPHLPLVFVTGDLEVPDTVKAMKGGAVDFLEKPVTREVLLEAIGRAVRRGDESRAAAREIDQLNTRYQRLTPREREVFALVSAGLLNKQVAAELGAAEKTIKQHRGRVMRKMQAESLAELVVMAQRLGVRGAGDFAEAKGRISRA